LVRLPEDGGDRGPAMEQPSQQGCLLSSLYQRYSGELRAYLRRKVSVGHEAEDLVQEVFLRVHRSLAAEQIEHPRAYLHQVANSVVTDHFRRNQRRGLSMVEVEPVDESRTASTGPTPEESAIGDEALDRVSRAIANLPQRVREAMLLRTFEGLSYRQVAATMGISERTVEKHLARASNDLVKGLAIEAMRASSGSAPAAPSTTEPRRSARRAPRVAVAPQAREAKAAIAACA